jgi:carboxypeptidase T
MARYHITITGSDREQVSELIRRHRVSLIRHLGGVEEGGYRVSAVANLEQIRALKAAGVRVVRHENVDRAAKATLADVGEGNRYRKRLGLS